MKLIGAAFFLLLTMLTSCNQEAKSLKQSIIRDNAVIDYTIHGNGGNTLLFVHDIFMDQTSWEAQVANFSPDYTVVTIDLPGHGNSGRERSLWSMEGFAYDVNTVVRQLKLKNVILIGHGLGADVNLLAAIHRPKDIIGYIAIENFKNLGTTKSNKSKRALDQTLKSFDASFALGNEKYLRKYLISGKTSDTLVQKVATLYRNAYVPMGKEILPEFWKSDSIEKKWLPQLKWKVHLINSDYKKTKEKSLKKYAKKGYDIQHFEGTSHFPMFENSNALNRNLQWAIDEIARENERFQYRNDDSIQSQS